MELVIDRAMEARLARVRELGEREIRPVGLEADRLSRPIPVDHAYFVRCLERGEGRTRWPGPGARSSAKEPAKKPSPRSTVLGLLLAEELAYWDRGVGVANPGPGLPELNVLSLGTEEQKERFLGPFLAPDRPRWASFAMTEPGAGSDAAAIATTARKDGEHFILNGAKCFIGNASRADWILVQASLDPRQGRRAQRAFFVERGTPGLGPFKIEKKMGLKAYESTSFALEDCRVPLANLLGGEARHEQRDGLQERDAHLQRGPPADRGQRGRHRTRSARRSRVVRARARSALRLARARSARAHDAALAHGPPSVPEGRLARRSGAPQRARGLDV
jgi:acyl-CoA dehydrogenase